MRALGIVFVLLLVAFAGVHGYLKMEYNTMDACDAALQRVKSDLDEDGLLGKGQSLLISLGEAVVGSNSLEENLEKEIGIMGCYKIAVMGSDSKINKKVIRSNTSK